ncbi:MAG: glycosyltransferase family 2 protein [Erysipelotrichaceae bacterium]
MISILTPTYNDAQSIEDTLKSVIAQTYKQWEWIIVNDGSTDNTDELIHNLITKYNIANKVKYVYQKNGDQLNAIIHGMEFISGDFVFILHTDDLLPSNDFFENSVSYLNSNPDCSGLFGDLILIDDAGNETGIQSVNEYIISDNVPPLLLLWLGRNLFTDVALHRVKPFSKVVKETYLTWNMPLWLNFTMTKVEQLPYKKAPFPVLKYRVHEGNYINSELGKKNVINGEVRTALQLMKFYEIPNYERQYFKYRLMNKLGIVSHFKVKYDNSETQNKYNVLAFIISNRYKNGVDDDLFLSSLLNFYKNKKERTLLIDKIPSNLMIYYGKDVRNFNRKLMNNTLEKFYVDILNEMNYGFNKILVKDIEDKMKIYNILKFLCIENEVSIKEEGEI